jgi:hypothetical protein
VKLLLLTAALILSTSVYAQDATKPPTGGSKSAARMKPKAVAAPSWGRSGVPSFGPVTVRRQTSLEAALRQPKGAIHLCRIKPLERSHPARNNPFVWVTEVGGCSMRRRVLVCGDGITSP